MLKVIWPERNVDLMEVTGNSLSSSLLARDVYCICFTDKDNIDVTNDSLAALRRDFFSGGRKTLKINKKAVIKGFDGHIKGKMTKRSLRWKKQSNGIFLERSFDHTGGYMIVYRNFDNMITAKSFFDKSHIWIKSEYYIVGNPDIIQTTFKPVTANDRIERFDYSPGGKCSSVELFPVQYHSATAEQSLINAKFGLPQVIISTAEGDFSYSVKEDAEKRKEAFGSIKDSTLLLTPAWEIKNGELTSNIEEDEELNVSFNSLEEYAVIEEKPVKADSLEQTKADIISETDKQETEIKSEIADSKNPDLKEPVEIMDKPYTDINKNEEPEIVKEVNSDSEAQYILETARKSVKLNHSSIKKRSIERSDNISGISEDSPETKEILKVAENFKSAKRPAGEFENIGGLSAETDENNTPAAYEGEYKNGKKDGFGSYRYKDGSLCYTGFWKDDKKDGLGVSFRNSDHSMHVASWHNNTPGEFVSLFDSEGNLRYSGKIIDGRKQGIGITYNADGTVFIGKWRNNEFLQVGSSFDMNGNLLYTGAWKDGKRNGNGTQFDQNGGVIFSGEWKDDRQHNGILYKKPDN